MERKYKKTLFTPNTNYPMKGNLKELESKISQQWKEKNLYEEKNKKNPALKNFILHDGPPFANGEIHLGHAVNKILKDILCRFAYIYEYNASFIPGWDCHGLPIENKILQDNKNEKIDICKEAEKFSNKWIEIQQQQFKNLEVNAEWESKYITTDKNIESKVVENFINLLKKNYIYRDFKPMLWSTKENSAMTSIDIQYKDHLSTCVYVFFPYCKNNNKNSEIDGIVIWTTTPWSIIANEAIAYCENMQYSLCKILNKKTLLAKDLIPQVQKEIQSDITIIEENFPLHKINKILYQHPFLNKQVPLIPSSHVDNKQGSGFVHIAPGHGKDDFEIGKKFNLPITVGIDERGFCTNKKYKNLTIHEVEKIVIEESNKNNNLLGKNSYLHSYPYSQRANCPLIYRATHQWFLNINHNNLKEKIIKKINQVNWLPKFNKKRILSVLQTAPDWCLSRQRKWGLPLPIFYNEKNEILCDDEIFQKTIQIFKKNGSEGWRNTSKESILGGKYKEYKKSSDIIDVWFESGCSYYFLLKEKNIFPADVYLEGSDQHRGWFYSSLVLSMINDELPYKKVFTHGFILDKNGDKMSKSKGNIISPQKIIQENSCDLFRLYISYFCDCKEDIKINSDIKEINVIYRKFRNILRYMMCYAQPISDSKITLNGSEKIFFNKFLCMENNIYKLWEHCDCHLIIRNLYDFCYNDISSNYIENRKNILYCEDNSNKKKEIIYLLSFMFKRLCILLCPFIPFTCEEAWLYVYKNSVHLQRSKPLEYDENKVVEYENILNIRKNINQQCEKIKKECGKVQKFTCKISCSENVKKYLLDIKDFFPEKIIFTLCNGKENIFLNEKIKILVEKYNGIICNRCSKVCSEEICKICKNIIHKYNIKID